MKRVISLAICVLSLSTCTSTSLDIFNFGERGEVEPPPELTIQGTVYLGMEPIHGFEVWVDIHSSYPPQVPTHQVPVDRDTGTYELRTRYQRHCTQPGLLIARARYLEAPESWRESHLQPLYDTPPSDCSEPLRAADITIPLP